MGKSRIIVLGEDAEDNYGVLSEDYCTIPPNYPIKYDGVNHKIVLSEEPAATIFNT